MRNNRIHHSFVILLLLLGISSMAKAAIISGTHTTAGGKSVALQGLEWLSLDHTQNMSRNTIEAVGGWTDSYGTVWGDSDWRYANRDETEALIGSLWGGVYDGYSTDNFDGASWFLSKFSGLGYDTGSGATRNALTRSDADWTNHDYTDFLFGDPGDCTPNSPYSCFGHVEAADWTYYDFYAHNVITDTEQLTYVSSGYEIPVGFFEETVGLDAGRTTYNQKANYSLFGHSIGSLLVRESASVPEPSALLLMTLGLLGLGLSRRKRLH